MFNDYYLGTVLKLQVAITATGFDQDSDDYSILIVGGSKSLHYTQDDVLEDNEDNKYIIIPTEELMPGTMTMVVAAYVPDSDIEGGVRKEVVSLNIGVLRPAKAIR